LSVEVVDPVLGGFKHLLDRKTLRTADDFFTIDSAVPAYYLFAAKKK